MYSESGNINNEIEGDTLCGLAQKLTNQPTFSEQARLRYNKTGWSRNKLTERNKIKNFCMWLSCYGLSRGPLNGMPYYISITIVQSQSGKYHEFVAVCIVFWLALYYGDNDYIIQTFNFIAHSDAAHVTCSTWYGFSCDLQHLIQILAWLAVLIRILVWLVVNNTAFYKWRAAARLPHWLPYISVI